MTLEKKRRGRWRWIAFTAALVLAGYPVAATLSQGYSWRESDWDGDGRTTLGEWFWGIDVETGLILVDGRLCTEYFDLKSANTIRVDCPARG